MHSVKFTILLPIVFFFNSYVLVEPPDMLWGSYVNGSFTGITGQFYRKVRTDNVLYIMTSLQNNVAHSAFRKRGMKEITHEESCILG